MAVACHRSAVGEANVVDRMIESQAVIGGEGNGGVIDPRVGLVRDPFIGMGMILNLMAETGKKLSELVAELPSYQIVKDKYTVSPEGLPRCTQALKNAGRKRRSISLMACGWIGRIAGSMCGRATRSRLSGSSPKRRTSGRRGTCVGKLVVC